MLTLARVSPPTENVSHISRHLVVRSEQDIGESSSSAVRGCILSTTRRAEVSGAWIVRVLMQCEVDVSDIVTWIYGSMAGEQDRLASFPWLVTVCSAVAVGWQLVCGDRLASRQSSGEVEAVVGQVEDTPVVKRGPPRELQRKQRFETKPREETMGTHGSEQL